MLFVSFTKQTLEKGGSFGDLKPKEFIHNGHVITAIGDECLAEIIDEGSRLVFRESPKVHKSQRERLTFLELVYDKADKLTVYKSTHSGRPLYYHINRQGELYFSTHISLLRKAGVAIRENISALPEFFVYRYVTAPMTLYKDIMCIPSGDQIRFQLNDSHCKIVSHDRYDPFRTQEKKEVGPIDVIAERAEVLIKEFAEPLRGMGEDIAFLLSGGLDSSVLFRLFEKDLGITKTHSTSYPFTNEDEEREYALSAAERFDVAHLHHKFEKNDYVEGFVRAISIAEVPIHHLQSAMFYLLFNKGIKPGKQQVVISGQGADGLFGLAIHDLLYAHGNRWHMKKFKPLVRIMLAMKMFKALEILIHRGMTFTQTTEILLNAENGVLEDPKSIVWHFSGQGGMDWACNFFGVSKDDIIANRYNAIEPFKSRSVNDIMSVLDFLSDVSNTQIVWSKLGEADKKIVFYPYTEKKLMDYVYSVPWGTKVSEPKNILREIARQTGIPDFIVNRKKLGFFLQREVWANQGGIFEPIIQMASDVFDLEMIRKLQNGNYEDKWTLWNILNYTLWKRLCIEKDSPDLLIEEIRANSTHNDN